MRVPARAGLILALVAILAGGLWLRAHHLAATPPRGDVSESALNALTILQTGLPRGTYLGLPIFENCLVQPWADNPEYEFRDSSYSRKKDLAIYHSWLPLYSMAASQELMGVKPDEASDGAPTVRHTDSQIRKRIIAARLPSVVFGGVFLIFLFLCGKEMFGTDAGLAAMLIGAIGRSFVYMAREARYESATLAISTACCWAIWRVYKYGRWADYLLACVLLVLLFYTHLLAFFVACVMFALLCPFLIKRDGLQALRKLAAIGAIGAALTLPWLLLSGFLDQTSYLPPARDFLSFPADLFYYPLVRIPYLILPAICFIWLAIVIAMHPWLPRALTRPIERHYLEIAFLLGWVVVGIAAFTFLIPAASYFYKRLTLAVMGPGVVWGAILFAAGARAWSRKYSIVLASALFGGVIIAGNMADLWFLERPDRAPAYDMVALLRQLDLTPDTRLYCTPNDQLTLQYLTGLPIQSVAPVRKKFLDAWPGPIVLIDSTEPYDIVPWEQIQELAGAWGYPLSDAEARRLEGPLSAYLRRKELPARTGATLDSTAPALPPFADRIAEYQRNQTALTLARFARNGTNNPMLRGYHLRDWSDWWPLFFYRFVDPEQRMHEHLNYADRIKGATAEVRNSTWVIFHCPPLQVAHVEEELTH
jgi:hypothetical protein